MNKVDVRAKLAELGLELPVAAKPVAAYVPAAETPLPAATGVAEATAASAPGAILHKAGAPGRQRPAAALPEGEAKFGCSKRRQSPRGCAKCRR